MIVYLRQDVVNIHRICCSPIIDLGWRIKSFRTVYCQGRWRRIGAIGGNEIDSSIVRLSPRVGVSRAVP